MTTPLLGWIEPAARTPVQHAAHAAATALQVQFALPVVDLARGESIRLFDLWKHPDVVADVGFVFERIHQQTGSCVWAGGTNAVFSTIAAQRVASEAPTRAFVPFTLHNYARSRHAIGWDTPGEGSLGSTFAQSLGKDGLRDWASAAGLPTFTRADGLAITAREEMAWSSVQNPAIQGVLSVARAHLFGSTAECKTAQDIRAMVSNGYGVTFACGRFIGHAAIRGEGKDAYVRGRWDSSGGHQQSVHAVWEHPNDGPLYWAQNNWQGDTYPTDPAGGPECGCWVAEVDVLAALRYDAEVYGLSHLSWFPAQPNLVSLLI